MTTNQGASISVEVKVNAPIEKVWKYWSAPEHITQWCFATVDWHVPYAENDLRIDGKFLTRMAAKDGSFSFDFSGFYTLVKPLRLIEYVLEDGRTVQITFTIVGESTIVNETFDPENENPTEVQRDGWQSILNNFKNYTESK